MKHTWMIGLTILTALTCLLSRVSVTEGVLENYNVVWTTPSQNSHGSMPLGNGDVGVNVWVEPSGDLVFFISKTDAWDENCRLCKLGRVRVTFDPPLPVDGSFRQELKLREGVIEISADTSKLALWVDANHPVVRLEAQTDTPTTWPTISCEPTNCGLCREANTANAERPKPMVVTELTSEEQTKASTHEKPSIQSRTS